MLWFQVCDVGEVMSEAHKITAPSPILFGCRQALMSTPVRLPPRRVYTLQLRPRTATFMLAIVGLLLVASCAALILALALRRACMPSLASAAPQI